ncbi:GNAT family N-acetyltransferase [Frankia sp. AgB32]|uniref:GNAT family N-acetyltransferase n=1 Tax=Frankia sp. AgB32 TaxID=631119 RepID=UPI00200C3EA3|nr:GNAT family N-acetyltransferase [Frankia sp. AgB32]MCK9895411.1 GNAT family N-acetyltransferase [Frankia sp. AgB32]
MPTLSAQEISSGRVVLRKAHDADRSGIIELFTDPVVRTYLGGPRPRRDVESHLDTSGIENATAKPGSYVIARNGTDRLIGTLMLARRPADRPGHVTDDRDELELSYTLRREEWGAGLAFEAAMAALRAAAAELPDQPILVVTQTANQRSLALSDRLGFRHVCVFEEFGAQQSLSVARLHSFAS